jgi:hypothetical protein
MNAPAWLGISLLVIALLLLLTMWAMIIIRRNQAAQKTTKKPASPRFLMRDGFAYAGQPGDSGFPPRIIASFARTGKSIEVCVDVSCFISAIGFNGWTKRRRLLIREIASFRRDEQITIPLFWIDTVNGARLWVWGDGNRSYTDRAERVIAPNHYFRCRAVFIAQDGSEEYIYFIMRTDKDQQQMPDVIGQHMFTFIDEWEREFSLASS